MLPSKIDGPAYPTTLFCIHTRPRLAYPGATNIEAGAHSVWPATGPAPAAGGVAGLLRDLAVGQRLLQFGDARVGDLGAPEDQRLQVG